MRILSSSDLFSTGYDQHLMCLNAGNTGIGTDHDNLLAQLETGLKESQQPVLLQQQLLQVQPSCIHTHTLSKY